MIVKIWNTFIVGKYKSEIEAGLVPDTSFNFTATQPAVPRAVALPKKA